MDAAAGTTSAAGSGMADGQSKLGTVGGIVTVAGSGKPETTGVQTLNGSSVVINSHNSESSTNSGSNNTSPATTIVNNGPGSGVKGNVILSSTSGTVIQTPLINTHNAATSTVISQPSSTLNSVPTVTLVRPPMQTPGANTSQSGSNTVLTSAVSVANPACSGPQSNKFETSKTIIQTTAQIAASSATAAVKSPTTFQNVIRTSIPTTIAANPGGIRAIAPQVLAPRLAQPQQNAPNIQNIQLPPGNSVFFLNYACVDYLLFK